MSWEGTERNSSTRFSFSGCFDDETHAGCCVHASDGTPLRVVGGKKVLLFVVLQIMLFTTMFFVIRTVYLERTAAVVPNDALLIAAKTSLAKTRLLSADYRSTFSPPA